MAVTLIGFVRYEGDPRYFRKVMLIAEQGDDDSALDDPQWITEGCDPAQVAVMDKFQLDQPETWPAMDGTI